MTCTACGDRIKRGARYVFNRVFCGPLCVREWLAHKPRKPRRPKPQLPLLPE